MKSPAPRTFGRLALLTAVATLAACSTTSPDVVSKHEAQRLATVSDGVVLSTRAVIVEGSQSGIGGAAGGLVGGVAGASVGGRREAMAVGVIGAVVGGVVGNAVERFSTREDAIEVLIQLRNGERRSIVQARGTETLSAGDAVILINTSGKVRVTRALSVQPSAPAASAPISG